MICELCKKQKIIENKKWKENFKRLKIKIYTFREKNIQPLKNWSHVFVFYFWRIKDGKEAFVDIDKFLSN
jgi:hypothetical protein